MAKGRKPRDRGAHARAPNLVTSKEAADLARLQGSVKGAERVLRKTGDPWKALEALGISRPKSPGRRSVSAQELEDLAGLYVNMQTWPLPDAPPQRARYLRGHEHLDLLLKHSASCIDAQRTGARLPETPAELVFIPDCDSPMSPQDALRNVALYRGVYPRQAYELLRRASSQREEQGLPPLELPPRPPR
jgi:hypothetical protein